MIMLTDNNYPHTTETHLMCMRTEIELELGKRKKFPLLTTLILSAGQIHGNSQHLPDQKGKKNKGYYKYTSYCSPLSPPPDTSPLPV